MTWHDLLWRQRALVCLRWGQVLALESVDDPAAKDARAYAVEQDRRLEALTRWAGEVDLVTDYDSEAA